MAPKASSKEENLDSEEALSFNDTTRTRLKRKPSRGRFSGWQGILVGTGIGIAIAVGGIHLFSRPTAKPPVAANQDQSQASQTVTIAPVEMTPITRRLNVTGTVAARDDLIPVLPQTTGLQIKQVLVREGDTVKTGQVLAILDQSVLKAQIDQAQAQLESAQAVVGQRLAARAQAEATLSDAQQQLRRYQTLANQGAISAQDLETRATTVATDQEAVRVAEANIRSAQADVRNNAARVEQLRTQVAQTIVRAPVNGIVAEKIAQIGDVTNGTQKLFSIIRNGLLEVDADVSQTQLPQVRIAAPALITSNADSRVRLQGQVREISPLVNKDTRQATVKINVPPTNLLRPGLFVQAAITTNTATGLTVPAQSVVSSATGGSTVFLVSGDGKARSQSVEVGKIINGQRVEITQGLKLRDLVVVAGAGYLKDGDRIQVVPQPKVPNSPLQ